MNSTDAGRISRPSTNSTTRSAKRPGKRLEPQLQPARDRWRRRATNEPSRANVEQDLRALEIVRAQASRRSTRATASTNANAEIAEPAEKPMSSLRALRRSAFRSSCRSPRRYHTRHDDARFVLGLRCRAGRAGAAQKVDIVSVTGCLKEATPEHLDAGERHRSGAEQRERAAGQGDPGRRRRSGKNEFRLIGVSRVQPAGAQGPHGHRQGAVHQGDARRAG